MTDPASLATPFLSPRTVRSLQGMIRRGFSTLAVFDDPPTKLTLYRLNETTDLQEALPERWYVLRYDTQRPGETLREVTATTPSTGTIRCFDTLDDPADLRLGDRFALDEANIAADVQPHVGVVTSVYPTRFGIVRGRFQIDEGAV